MKAHRITLTIGVFLGVALVGAVLAFGAAAFFVAVVFFTLGTTAACKAPK